MGSSQWFGQLVRNIEGIWLEDLWQGDYVDGPVGIGPGLGILYGGDFRELGGRDDLLYMYESPSPAAWYSLSGLMIKCSQQ